MTPQQKMLVQSSFEMVAPISDQAAELFYGKLFSLDPELQKLFKSDMKEQGAKLMRMIGMAVNGLDRLDELVPVVEDLGRRHVDYGVKDGDYDTVGAALIWTLEQGLGEKFTPEVREAWTVVYTILADTMKNAAAEAA
jgi:hemoglobin-like flavoprotein